MRCLAAFVGLAPLAQAAVAGAPEPGPAGTLASAAVSSSNDLFGNGVGNGDDFRSAGAGGMLRHGRLVVAVDAALLTDRVARTRSDEAVVMAGAYLGPLEPHAGWHASTFLGLGMRIDGDLGGQRVQNLVHDTINVDQVHETYDRPGHIRPAVAGSAVVGWLGPAGCGLTGWWGGQLVAATQYAIGGEAIVEAGPRLVLVGGEGAFWVGMLHRWRDGEPPTTTVAATGAHEDGVWFDSGTWITPLTSGDVAWGWQVRASLNPETRAALGSVGLVVQPGAGPIGRQLALEHDLAVYNGGGFGVQLRWYPFPYQDLWRGAMVLDYRFGTEPDGRLSLSAPPGGAPVGADLRHDQWTAGWEEGIHSPDWSGLRFVAYGQAGAGLRMEGVLAESDRTRFANGHATTLVGRAALGLRVEWRETLSLGASFDGWLPAWREELRDGADAVLLNDPGWALGAHLAAHIAW